MPASLVHDGKIDHISLRKVQMTTHELESSLRAAGYAGPAGVRFAVLENTGKVSPLDGLSVVSDDWHFNVRPSNTEPLLRLNLEATSEDLMERKRDEVLSLIRS